MAALALGLAATGAAQDETAVVLEFRWTPAPRAQVAIWLEDADGRFLRTVYLTEATAFRGVGNRPGASLMNSGYRWPYGRREGVLPVWAARRASAPGARGFRRVIFQNRSSEGLASRQVSDQSVDDYYCLSFNRDTTTRDALDAVSCASVFTSDKGRFITEDDVGAGYAEPWEDSVSLVGSMQPLSLYSLYPPRMDVGRCVQTGCYDHVDLDAFAAEARAVMPEIDEVSQATPAGGVGFAWLFTLPESWPAGDYVAWIEVHVEGDYNATYNDTTFPTPTTPSGTWDSWAMGYGYPYRGQPSVVYQLPFELGPMGAATWATSAPVASSSWNFWSADYGQLEPMTGMSDDPVGAPGSGADRLFVDGSGQRFIVGIETLMPLVEPEPGEDPWTDVLPMPTAGTGSGGSGGSSGTSGGGGGQGGGGAAAPDPGVSEPPVEEGEPAVIIVTPESSSDVGPIRELEVKQHENPRHSHEWVRIAFLAPDSSEALHGYDVRVGTEPITDEESFIRGARPAKTATEGAEGAVALMLDPELPTGSKVEGEIGNLSARTRYWVAVRARDRLARTGPLSVAAITTTDRTFATVTPCFVATAAYGSPLAAQVGALRGFRDRYLMSHPPGRWLVRAYYVASPVAANFISNHGIMKRVSRLLLRPVVALADWLGSA